MYNQLATYKEAEEIARQIGLIGGGVKETYIPEYGGPYLVPEKGDSKFLHFRFANGAEGFNVGLIRALMQNSPLSWPTMLVLEVQAGKKHL